MNFRYIKTNPTRDNLFIKNSVSELSKYRFDILGQGGRIVMKSVKLIQGSIPLDGNSSGVYYPSVQKRIRLELFRFLSYSASILNALITSEE